MPRDDWTDVLPPVEDPSCQPGTSWQQLAEPPRPRRPAEAWYRANVYATYAVWSLAAALAVWVLLVLFVATWKAR